MPVYIITALAGYALLAMVFVLDKVLVSKSAVSLPAPVVAFYSTATLLPILLLIPFGVQAPSTVWQWWQAIISGATFVAALLYMYYGFEHSKVSHSGPLVGVITALATLAVAKLFLSEALVAKEWLGVGILIIGSLAISLKQSRGHYGWHRGMLYAVLAGICFALSNTFAKNLYDSLGFVSGLVISRGAIGVAGLVLLAHPEVRNSITAGFHKHHPKRSRATTGFWALFISDKVLGVVGVVLIQLAVALGSVSVVSALQGFQYGILIIGTALISRFRPKIFFERYAKGELKRELMGAFLIALGLLAFI